MPGCDGAGTAEKSYPSVRSGAAAERRYPAKEVRGGGQEELPDAPKPETRGGSGRSYPMLEARGGGPEDQPHNQGTRAAQARRRA